jgi:hypothetical protein
MRKHLVTSALAVSLMLLAGCGGDDGADSAESDTNSAGDSAAESGDTTAPDATQPQVETIPMSDEECVTLAQAMTGQQSGSPDVQAKVDALLPRLPQSVQDAVATSAEAYDAVIEGGSDADAAADAASDPDVIAATQEIVAFKTANCDI